MKNKACPFEQCKFSGSINHIHCIRPHCSYVLHSAGQLYSHKRKHERNDSELAYRKYKSVSVAGRPSSWGPEDMNLSANLSLSLNGESSNEGRGSPSYYSMDDSYQSGSDFAMDLSAPSTTAPPSSSGSINSIPEQNHQPQRLTSTELAYLAPASAECPCNFGREHHHCALERCGATLRDPREAREHLQEHETQERITDTNFDEGNCEETCPYADKEKHYHCKWENCREVILATDKPFRRLQHYKIHEYSRMQLDLSCSSHALSSDVTLTHLTNIDAMFRRKRGRPPKNRVIEIWSGGDPTSHTQDSPQAIFTSFKLPKPTATGPINVTPNTSIDDREGSSSPPSNYDEPPGFTTYNPDTCSDFACPLRSTKHYHCSQARCYFSTDRPDQLLMHSKDFHDNVEILPGFAFFDKMIDCRLPSCHSNYVNRHFHCIRPNCGYSFVRYSNMALHEKTHSEGNQESAATSNPGMNNRNSLAQTQSLVPDVKPRIQVKNTAELIEKPEESVEINRAIADDKEPEISSPDANRTTGELKISCGTSS